MIPAIFIVPEGYNNEKWPKTVAAVPRARMEYVESESGKILKVEKVIHSTSQMEGIRNKISPILKIELTDG